MFHMFFEKFETFKLGGGWFCKLVKTEKCKLKDDVNFLDKQGIHSLFDCVQNCWAQTI
jgi:hypothetical protein